jgi:hypothetical protein
VEHPAPKRSLCSGEGQQSVVRRHQCGGRVSSWRAPCSGEDQQGVIPNPFRFEAVDDVSQLIIQRGHHAGQVSPAGIADRFVRDQIVRWRFTRAMP